MQQQKTTTQTSDDIEANTVFIPLNIATEGLFGPLSLKNLCRRHTCKIIIIFFMLGIVAFGCTNLYFTLFKLPVKYTYNGSVITIT
jgi:hypothetical protein